MRGPGREIPSDFRLPAIAPSLAAIESYLRSADTDALESLVNPHHEPQVAPEQRARATPAAVLIPLVERAPAPGVVLTRRHERIRFGGHISFPGGRLEPDETPVAAALRETHEEIGLAPSEVRVLGRLGDYFTHHGYRIAPVIGVLAADTRLTPHEAEVDAIIEVPLTHFTHPRSYRLRERSRTPYRANYSVRYQEHYIGGPTLSILMNFYRMLVEAGIR